MVAYLIAGAAVLLALAVAWDLGTSLKRRRRVAKRLRIVR